MIFESECMSKPSSELVLSARERRAVELIGRARELIPMLDRAGERVESSRRVPDDVLDALHDASLFRLLIPRSLGGEEVEPATYFQVLEAIAQGDASVAWCVGQASGVSIAAAYLKPEVASAVFSDRRAVAASGPNNPKATAVVCDGGYRVSGDWTFASGSKHSTWLCGHSTICEPDGRPRVGPDGEPLDLLTVLFPKSSAVVTDVWDVMGLQGTASDNYSTRDLFVPADFSFTRESDKDRKEQGPLYRFNIFNLFGLGFSAVALGVASRALDEFIKLATKKTASGKTSPLSDNNVIQSQVGLSDMRLRSSRTHVIDVYQTVYRAAERRERFDQATRVALRTATCHAIHQAREVMNFVYHAAGATAIFTSNPFERRFRDLHTLTQQGQAAFSNFESHGKILMGLTSKDWL
ncbi:alkylation response protein AidB-like acyl-CoA dehydrogenase [Bradyrhizobium sp. S3.3.6]